MTLLHSNDCGRLSVAPMMDWTDRHYRYFARLISKRALLYTEMITTGAILHGDRDHLIGYHDAEHPLAIQLGGSDPQALAQCAGIAQDYGYDEVNLNVGCPSDRVQSGRFGACLMAEPQLVADCVAAMKTRVQIPVTVKSRIGIDDLDSYELLCRFVELVNQGGCQHFIIHARKAWLSGLSPKENRQIPPLHYDRVYQLKQDFPQLRFSINGGITTSVEVKQHLAEVDGVMIGREAYHNPYVLADMEREAFGVAEVDSPSRFEVAEQLIPYIDQQLAKGASLIHITRHIHGLFHSQPAGKQWRRYLSENAHKAGATSQVVSDALDLMRAFLTRQREQQAAVDPVTLPDAAAAAKSR